MPSLIPHNSTVFLNNLRFHAYHGLLEQERTIGNDYELTVTMQVTLDAAVESDDVTDTINYAEAFDIINREMMIPSCLLEHVAGRIAKSLANAFPIMKGVTIKLIKVNPPMGADSDGAGVEISFIKNE